ncbi:MAG: DUF6080 domain-containing protein [Prevotella sp.]|nr:DUF6080 domain-containing protein [Prevotella sp.]
MNKKEIIRRALVLAYVTLLNALVIVRYWHQFSYLNDNYRKLVLGTFHISGFDPLSYIVIDHWTTAYNIYRHPLLAFFMWLPSQLNAAVEWLTGRNAAPLIMGCILVACAYYTYIYMVHLLHRVVGIGEGDAWLLTTFLFSFAYVMVTVSVPDHFCLSMFMLTLVLYLSGMKMKEGKLMPRWQSVLLFFLTAGISLNNGIKVFLANLFVGGKRFWRPANLLLTCVLPAALIWGFARWEWYTYERPNFIARQEAKAKKHDKLIAKTYQQVADTMHTTDTALIRRTALAIVARQDSVKAAKSSRLAIHAHEGKPIANGEFSQWTDISTPRGWSLTENVLGEPIQLHSDHLLEDVLRSRPVIVHYRFAFNYIAEALVLLLFLFGVWAGRCSRFLWLALSFLGFDLLIHVVLGFGLNEAYIMSTHWLIVVPIAVAYLLKDAAHSTKEWIRLTPRLLIGVLTLYLLIYNGTLYVGYLY